MSFSNCSVPASHARTQSGGAVPAQEGGFNRDVDVAVSDAALAHDFAGCDVVELNGFVVGRQPALIGAGQQQQVLHEHPHTLRFRNEGAGRQAEVEYLRVGNRNVEGGDDRRQRAAQLV